MHRCLFLHTTFFNLTRQVWHLLIFSLQSVCVSESLSRLGEYSGDFGSGVSIRFGESNGDESKLVASDGVLDTEMVRLLLLGLSGVINAA